MPPHILSFGLNPALQTTLSFPSQVKHGNVNRATTKTQTLGGKGQTFVRALSTCSTASTCSETADRSDSDQSLTEHVETTIVQFLGGQSGSFIEEYLTTEYQQIRQLNFYVQASTRTCTTLLDPCGMMELVEPSATIPQDVVEEMLVSTTRYVQDQDVDGITINGTFPPGVDVFAVCSRLQSAGGDVRVVLMDAYKGGVHRVLHELDFVTVLKINAEELEELCKLLEEDFPGSLAFDASSPSSQDDNNSQQAEQAIVRNGRFLMQKLAHRTSLAWIVVTSGHRATFGFQKETRQIWKISLSGLELAKEVVNPIGAGDTMAAGLTSYILSHGEKETRAFLDGVIHGTAMATASCFHRTSAKYDNSDVTSIKEQLVAVAM